MSAVIAPYPSRWAGCSIAAEQRAELDGDVDGGPLPVGFGQTRIAEDPGKHVDERVSAALIPGARIGLGAAERVQHRLDERGAVGGQQRPQFGDAVVFLGEHHPPLRDGVVVTLFSPARVSGTDGLLLSGLQQRDVPFERHQQINPPGV